MGLKDFLNKKPVAGDLDSALQGQSYSSTTAAQAPKKGNLPVAGNGPNTLEHLQRVAKSRSHSHLKGSISPAPTSPALARVQNQHAKRPSTSSVFSSFSNFHRPQSSHSTGTATRSNGEALLSPTSSNGGRKYGPYRIYKDGDAPYSGGVPPVPHIPDHYSRNGSIDSSSILSASTQRNKKGYVDLLDAQSDIKPADFYSRVRATGARNYGEDVAERNLLEGKANAVTSSSAVLTKNHLNGASEHAANRVSMIREDAREARYSPPTPEPIAKDAVPGVVAARRRSGKDFDSERFSEHRKSFGEVSATNSKRRSKPKDLDLNLAVSKFGVRPSVSMPAVNRAAKATPTEYDDDEDDDDEQTPRQATIPPSGAGKYPPRRAKSSASTNTATHRYAGKQQSHLVPPLPTKNRGEIGFIQSEAGLTDSDIPDDQSTSPAPSPVVSRHTEGGLSIHSRSQKSYKSSLKSSRRDSSYSQSRPSSASSYATQSRAKPLGETTLQAVLDDIVENIPARSSSLAQWPLRPESPPTTVSSIQSSNTFSPLRSYHTASTSIDGGRTPSVNNDGHVRTKSRGHSTASYTPAHEDQRPQSRARQIPKETKNKRDTVESQTSAITEDLNTTDGSDVEAYVAKRRQRKRDKEQESVHSESRFGDIGKDLPGLFSSTSAAGLSRWGDVPDTPRAPARFATAELEALFAARFQQEVLTPKSPYSERLTRAVLDPSISEEYDSDLQSTYSRDEADPAHDRALRLLAAMKAQGLNVMDLVDLEESLQQRQERQDIKTAIRLRKEMKKIERMERLRHGGAGTKTSRAGGNSAAAQGLGY